MKKNIKILGTGCPKCKTMTSMVEVFVQEHNIAATVEKVEDIMKIMEYNVLTTPALVIDEKIVIKGRLPSVTELDEFIN